MSPDNTRVPPSASITDDSGAVWSLGGLYPGSTINHTIIRDGAAIPGACALMVWCQTHLYVKNGETQAWYVWNGLDWAPVSSNPCDASNAPPLYGNGLAFPPSANLVYPALMNLPAPPTDANELVSQVIINTGPYIGDGVWKRVEWVHNGTRPIKILRSYLWTGIDRGGVCDVHCQISLKKNGAMIQMLEWDHYAEPTTHQGQWREINYVRMEPGESIYMDYFMSPFSGTFNAHHMAQIDAIYL